MLTKTEIVKIQKAFGGKANRIVEIFDVLGEKNRFKMFKLFLERKDLCVTDVANVLRISVPAASQHLKVLERTGLIECEKKGQACCYKVKKDDKDIRSIVKLIK